MKSRLLICASALVLCASERAMAADLATIATIPVILNLVILAGAAACLSVAIKLYTLVRGGALARAWQTFIISFATLAVGQLFVLAREIKWFAPSFDLSALLYLVTVALWFWGLVQTRKVLE